MNKKSLKIFMSLLLFCLIGFLFLNPSKKETVSLEIKGVNLVAPIQKLDDSTMQKLEELHINFVSIIPYAFVNHDNAKVIFNYDRQWWGEKSEGINYCIKASQDEKKQVMLKPHLWINHGVYTGHLDFESENKWLIWENDFEIYTLEMATIAEKNKVALFCFGTEVGNAIEKRPTFWNALIKKIKSVYSGKLTYAANWDDFEKVPFWNQLDYIGIDAYFPLSENETPTVDSLKEAWKKPILKMEILSKKYAKQIIFTEFGYRNSNECAKEPWTEKNLVENNQCQKNAYEALFSVMSQKTWFKGGFFWKWYADDYYKKHKIDYTPQDKIASEEIIKWYAN